MSAQDDSQYYEYIVVGCGGVGSAALYWLSRSAKVLGLEQFKLGHEYGSSQDFSRIIRKTQHNEKYARLVDPMYEAWEEVEKESGLQLVYKTGGIHFAKKGSPGEKRLLPFIETTRKMKFPCEVGDGATLSARFPQIQLTDDYLYMYQKDGGLVDAALSIAVHIQLARKHGAVVIDDCPVTRVEKIGKDNIKVYTASTTFRCRRLIVTAGAWTSRVLASVGVRVPITVTQEQVTYLATPNIKDFTKAKFPNFIYHADNEDIYGMAIHGNAGSKVGIDAAGPEVTPETRTYEPDPVREKRVLDFFEQFMPGALGPKLYTKTCLYNMTHDRDFVIDTLSSQGLPEIVLCCDAAHAFKYACIIGKILSQLAIYGRTHYPISGFEFARPAILDPTFKPNFRISQQAKL